MCRASVPLLTALLVLPLGIVDVQCLRVRVTVFGSVLAGSSWWIGLVSVPVDVAARQRGVRQPEREKEKEKESRVSEEIDSERETE